MLRWCRNIFSGSITLERPGNDLDALQKQDGRLVAIHRFVFCFLGILVCSLSMADVNDFACGSLQNAYGPFDYRSDKDKLAIVEAYHLTPNVINLTSPQSAGAVGGDLDYVLRAFPNHPIALMSMLKLGEKEKVIKPKGAKYGVECYFQRALRFRNDDATVKMIYASYLAKNGKKVEALTQLDEASRLEEDNAIINYNTGLIYFELRDYEKALFYAHRAYGLGFPLPGLREKLKRVGKWKEHDSIN